MMHKSLGVPKVNPGGLVTVALLKARYDGKSDHLSFFMPLVHDTIWKFSGKSFIASDVKKALEQSHCISMPEHTVETLLRRLAKNKVIDRNYSRYNLSDSYVKNGSSIETEKQLVKNEQQLLGDKLKDFAKCKGIHIETTEHALDMLFDFIEQEQIALLLDDQTRVLHISQRSGVKRAVVAKFIRDVIGQEDGLKKILKKILEGLILYKASFLPNINSHSQKFKNLKVAFDSMLVLQLLGYEGEAMETLMRETVDVLKSSGVECIVFDKSVDEIRRILAMYENKLSFGQLQKMTSPPLMARHLLTKRLAPSDLRVMSAILETNITDAGLAVVQTPTRTQDFTAGELALAARLANRDKRDDSEPRVVHDVDCIAGILTFRMGRQPMSLDDAKAIFATSSNLVVKNVKIWWNDDEHMSSIAPITSIRSLTNRAWVKRPSHSENFKIDEAIALCCVALKPKPETWNRFLGHLDSLVESKTITTDEMTTVIVSSLSDQLLNEVEFCFDDSNDIDAVTLDDVVRRVTEDNNKQNDIKVQAISDKYECDLSSLKEDNKCALKRAEIAESAYDSIIQSMDSKRQRIAYTFARITVAPIHYATAIIISIGAIALLVSHPYHGGLYGYILAFCIAIFMFLEAFCLFKHIEKIRSSAEIQLRIFYCRVLSKIL